MAPNDKTSRLRFRHWGPILTPMSNENSSSPTITNPRAHGLRGLSVLTADRPTDPSERKAWNDTFLAALDERDATIELHGARALMAAIEAAEGETLKDQLARFFAGEVAA